MKCTRGLMPFLQGNAEVIVAWCDASAGIEEITGRRQVDQETEALTLPHGTLSGDGFIWTLGQLCTLHGVPFDPALFMGQFPPPYSVEKLLAALGALGIQAGQTNALAITPHNSGGIQKRWFEFPTRPYTRTP